MHDYSLTYGMLQTSVNYVAQLVRQVKQACGSRPDIGTVQHQLHRRPIEYNKVISHWHEHFAFSSGTSLIPSCRQSPAHKLINLLPQLPEG